MKKIFISMDFIIILINPEKYNSITGLHSYKKIKKGSYEALLIRVLKLYKIFYAKI